MLRAIWPCVALAIASGCSAFQKVTPISLNEAIRDLEAELAQIGLASTADLLSDDPKRKHHAERYVRSRQCAFKTPNPLFLSPDSVIALELKGVFTQSGGFKVTSIPATPSGEISASASASAENKLNMKVNLVSLSGVPTEYLKVGAALINTPGLPPATVEALKAAVPENHRKLRVEIERLQNSFDPAACK